MSNHALAAELFPSCGFFHMNTTATGAASATNYACGPAAPGNEVVYEFRPVGSGPTTVTMQSNGGLELYMIQDTGNGCSPQWCIEHSASAITFNAVAGNVYYFAVDDRSRPLARSLSCSSAGF